MPYLIDTNIAIDLRDGDSAMVSRIGAITDAVLMSVITRVELEGGVYRDPGFAAIRRARLDIVLRSIPVVAFGDEAADTYAAIVAAAGYSRRKLLDRMIAAQALVHRATLITRNAGDFADIPNLVVEAW